MVGSLRNEGSEVYENSARKVSLDMKKKKHSADRNPKSPQPVRQSALADELRYGRQPKRAIAIIDPSTLVPGAPREERK